MVVLLNYEAKLFSKALQLVFVAYFQVDTGRRMGFRTVIYNLQMVRNWSKHVLLTTFAFKSDPMKAWIAVMQSLVITATLHMCIIFHDSTDVVWNINLFLAVTWLCFYVIKTKFSSNLNSQTALIKHQLVSALHCIPSLRNIKATSLL